jgi:hypothetical protein
MKKWRWVKFFSSSENTNKSHRSHEMQPKKQTTKKFKIPGYQGFVEYPSMKVFSTHGDVVEARRSLGGDGYHQVHLRPEGSTRLRVCQLGRIIHDTLIFDSKGQGVIEFINGNRNDFGLDNLRLVSHSYIGRKSRQNCRFKKRAISDMSAREIKRKNKSGISQFDLAREYGVTQPTISNYINAK